MNKFILIIVLTIFVSGVIAQKPTAFNLDQAIDFAMNNSSEMINAKLKVLDAKKQKIETRAIGLPKLSTSAGYNYFIDIPTQLMPDFLSPAIYGVLLKEGLVSQPSSSTGGVFPVQFGQKHNLTLSADINSLIFSGEYIVALKTSKVFEDFSIKEMENVKKTIKDKVIDAYIPPLLIEENLKILNKNISNLQKMKDEIEEMYKEGFVEQIDVDRLTLSLANLKIQKENLTRQLDIVKNALKITIGYPVKDSLILDDSIENLLAKKDDGILFKSFDFNNRPDFKMMQKSLELQNLNIKRYKSQYLPTLAGFASYSQKMTGNTSDDLKWYPTTLVGLQLNFTLFDGLGRSAKVQRAKIAEDIAKNNLDNMQNAISMQVKNARLSYENALKNLNALEENLNLAEKIYNTTKEKYKEGVGSSVELTQAEQSLYTAQSNVIKAKFDLLNAKIKLYSALGF
ncbi:MAG TPA: TolC family protein [Bacteroidetes bacterium]|nr:TolC family protein [Bacteroidota bacterium]